MFDTHKLVRKLRESGFEERHAEGLSDALKHLELGRDLITRRDLEIVRQEVRDMEFRVDARFQIIKNDLIVIKLLLLFIAACMSGLVAKFFL